jgi:NAD/NADP transhydrogenase alpha subunit
MEMFVAALTVFVLAVFVGFELITKVPPLLHTPLMSGSNAISGITVIGAMLVGRDAQPLLHGAGAHRDRLRHGQCRGRIPRDPPHARHVQEEGLTP